MSRSITQRDIILQYYTEHPDRDISHPEVVDWATKEYTVKTGRVFRDPDRQIRQLHQQGYLIKVKKGVYRYNPNPTEKSLVDFTPQQKAKILENGNYKCAVCGVTEKAGNELQIDHIKPRDKGGESTISNGQVLCSVHNFRKKQYNQTETAKQLFVNLYNRSKELNDETILRFCEDILQVYDQHDINGHIDWDR